MNNLGAMAGRFPRIGTRRRTNRLLNSNLAGAATGTLTGGYASPPMPTGWATPSRNVGTTVDVTPITVSGRPGLSLRFLAAAPLAVATADTLEFGTRDDIVCGANEPWVGTFWYRLADGTFPAGTSFRARIVTRDASNVVVQAVGQVLTIDATWRQSVFPITTGAGVIEIMTGLQMFWTTGVQPDVTIEIYGPGLAQGSIPLP